MKAIKNSKRPALWVLVFCGVGAASLFATAYDIENEPVRALSEGLRVARLECKANQIESEPQWTFFTDKPDHLFDSLWRTGVAHFITFECGAFYGQYVFKMPNFYGTPSIAEVHMGKMPGPGVDPREVTRIFDIYSLGTERWGHKTAALLDLEIHMSTPLGFPGRDKM